MTAKPQRAADALGPLEQLQARAWAVATAFALGKIDLITAVDRLQDYAFGRGLIDELGQDAVQQIISEAFAPARRIRLVVDQDEYAGLTPSFARLCRKADAATGARPMLEDIPIARHGVPTASTLQRIYERGLKRPAATTVAAAAYLVRIGDPARLEQWLMERPPQERVAIIAELRKIQQGLITWP
jgi:hypothetical protein